MQKPQITVIGSSNTDMVVKSPRLPRPGETVLGGTFITAAGGKGANQAVAAARLGIEVTFIARLGTDIFGDQALEGFRREGINTEWIVRDEHNASGVALILVDDKAENLISVALGANDYLSAEDVLLAESAIAASAMVVAQLETPLETLIVAAEIAQRHNVPMMLDPAPAPDNPLPQHFIEKLTLIKPNEHEASRLTGVEVKCVDSARRACEVLKQQGARNVIITLGTAGSFVAAEGSDGVLVPAECVSAVDTTAAGDAYSGALAVAIASGKSLVEAARFATKAAAISVTRLGAQPSLPFVAEVMRFAVFAAFAVLCMMMLATVPHAMGADNTAPPLGVIFDTDMGNDVDDALALAVIHALVRRGECQLLAVTLTKDNRYAPIATDIFNHFYGRSDIPLGICQSGITPDDGLFIAPIATATDESGRFIHPRSVNTDSVFPAAAVLLRKTLAAQPDKSVVIIQVGFSTNLARLLATPADEISPLPGKSLVEKKVRYIAVMAGMFGGDGAANYTEYNVVNDIPAAKQLFAESPVDIIASGFEIGLAVTSPAFSMERDYSYATNHPIREAYRLYLGGFKDDRPAWDLTSVLDAVRPDHGYFQRSEPGVVRVNDDGSVTFQPSPNGRHRFLKLGDAVSIARCREALVQLASEPPR